LTDDRIANTSATRSPLAGFDQWMAAHPWHPRVVPLIIYLLMLSAIQFVPDGPPISYLQPVLYVLQCGVVLWLLWRYRRLLPEMTLAFDWRAVPVGVGVFVVWVVLGWLTAGEFSARWDAMLDGQPIGLIDYGSPSVDKPALATNAADGPFDFRHPAMMGLAVGWVALVLRLLGMSIVVPLFEELFTRSLLLRSFHNPRRTAIGLLHFLLDLPVIGEWIAQTRLGRRADAHEPVFGPEFHRIPLGALSVFGIAASTFVFMLNHGLRDWPGTIVCGIAYSLLVGVTGRTKGLGPVIWAHGITNALLWTYVVVTGDWQFL
jgi:membrane protease YdiL (CAAX protease family)